MKSLEFFLNSSVGKTYLISVVTGIIFGLAHAPTDFVWLIPICIPVFYLLIHNKNLESKKSQFLVGWWFGFGYFLVTLYWISFALHVEWDRFFWVLPFALFCLPMVLAIYKGLLSLFLRVSCSDISVRSIFIFALFWTGIEYLQTNLFTGFPWNLTAVLLVPMTEVMQILSLFGPHIAGFLIVFCSTIWIKFLWEASIYKRLIYLFIPIIILSISFLYGDYRLNNFTDHQEKKNLDVLVVQPNIPQKEKWRSAKKHINLDKLISLTKQHIDKNKRQIFIWPETAITSYLGYDKEIWDKIISVIHEDMVLITGALHIEYDRINEATDRYNSFFSLIKRPPHFQRYDKKHLVPFGEYFPLLRQFGFGGIASEIGFREGQQPDIMTIDSFGLNILPLICYEVIFPSYVRKNTKYLHAIINITNDAWYLNSSGPYQHKALSIMRSVESGLPLIRSANTGISVVTDAVGRTIQSLELGHEGVIKTSFPNSLESPTPYFLYGNLIDFVFFMLFLLFLAVIFYRTTLKHLIFSHFLAILNK